MEYYSAQAQNGKYGRDRGEIFHREPCCVHRIELLLGKLFP